MSKRDGFVAHLKRLDNAALAELRRSLSFRPGEYPRAFPFLERLVSENSRQREVYYLAAGLYALKERAPEKQDKMDEGKSEESVVSYSLGQSAGRIRDREGKRVKSTEARFIHLLEAERDELRQPLRQMISLLKAAEQSVDWNTLLEDLFRWDLPDRKVQIRWAQDFYREPLDDQPE